MDTQNIFDLFNDSPEEQGRGPKVEPQRGFPEDFISFGSFLSLVLEYDLRSRNMFTFLKEVYKDLDIESLTKRSRLLIYAKAYECISKFDFNNPDHVDALLEIDPHSFSLACDRVIDELTLYERYEECAFLKNLKDFTLFSQNKLPY